MALWFNNCPLHGHSNHGFKSLSRLGFYTYSKIATEYVHKLAKSLFGKHTAKPSTNLLGFGMSGCHTTDQPGVITETGWWPALSHAHVRLCDINPESVHYYAFQELLDQTAHSMQGADSWIGQNRHTPDLKVQTEKAVLVCTRKMWPN